MVNPEFDILNDARGVRGKTWGAEGPAAYPIA